MGVKTVAAVGASVVAAAGGVGGWAWWLARRQHHWKAALAESIPVNSKYWRDQSAKHGELLYVAIGDSAAQGIGASRPAHSYVGFIARRIRSRISKPLRVTNLGISGATVRIAIDSELPRLAKLNPDIVTVCIGANDIAAWDADRFGREIRRVLAAVPSHAIVADLPSFYFLPGEKKVLEANRILRAAAAEFGLEVVPLHERTKRQGLWGVTTQFAGDLFHPNDRGYRIWADAFTPAVDRRLAELGVASVPASAGADAER
ncbi:SGNH/GDSL hydrolase family protein [Rathayibacter sp. YIM 133350]|uniref:SGNH/GDSL hydrolase family protein n=1 Tax=Rathayibacter sp. YIM 133350 TaxID=3131992 RepID=UPI00307F9425